MNKSRVFITKLCGYLSLLLSFFYIALLIILTSNIDRYIVWLVNNSAIKTYKGAMILLTFASVYLCLSIVFGLIMANVYFKVIHFSLIKRRYFASRFRGLIITHAILGGGIITSLIYGIYVIVNHYSKQNKISKFASAQAKILDENLQSLATAIELLRREYFLGNISKEEYAQRLNALLDKKEK